MAEQQYGVRQHQRLLNTWEGGRAGGSRVRANRGLDTAQTVPYQHSSSFLSLTMRRAMRSRKAFSTTSQRLRSSVRSRVACFVSACRPLQPTWWATGIFSVSSFGRRARALNPFEPTLRKLCVVKCRSCLQARASFMTPLLVTSVQVPRYSSCSAVALERASKTVSPRFSKSSQRTI